MGCLRGRFVPLIAKTLTRNKRRSCQYVRDEIELPARILGGEPPVLSDRLQRSPNNAGLLRAAEASGDAAAAKEADALIPRNSFGNRMPGVQQL